MSFKAIRARLGLPEKGCHHDIIAQSRSDDNDLCHEMLTTFGFTEDQMHRAAERFHLGRSKSGKTIYWMIDELGICRDGHIGDSWVSQMLKARCPEVAQYICPRHCLFGLHLLSQAEIKPIGIVESERSAVILSEARPELLWLAYAYPSNLTVDQFAPLRGLTVTLFPRADPDEFLAALELADQVKRTYRDIDISVSSFLEDHASPDQKSRNIDLVDFLFDSS